MNRIILTLLILLIASPVIKAQASKTTLQDITVAQMYEYAKALYERGDYMQAKQVMAHILALDPSYGPMVSKYDKKMVPQEPKIIVRAPDVRSVPSTSMASNEDLKAAMAQEDRSIQILNQEINQLRSETQAQNHE